MSDAQGGGAGPADQAETPIPAPSDFGLLLQHMRETSANTLNTHLAIQTGSADSTTRLNTLDLGLLEISAGLQRIETETQGHSVQLNHILRQNEEIVQVLRNELADAIGLILMAAMQPIHTELEAQLARRSATLVDEAAKAARAANLLAEAGRRIRGLLARCSARRPTLFTLIWLAFLVHLVCALGFVFFARGSLLRGMGEFRNTETKEPFLSDYSSIFDIANILIRKPTWRDMLKTPRWE